MCTSGWPTCAVVCRKRLETRAWLNAFVLASDSPRWLVHGFRIGHHTPCHVAVRTTVSEKQAATRAGSVVESEPWWPRLVKQQADRAHTVG